MARGVFTFTSEGRQRLAGVLRALLIAQLVVSLCMVIFCYNTSVKVFMLLKHIHERTVFLLYGLLLLHVYCMKLHYTSGLRLMSWFLKGPYWVRLTAVSNFWMISGSLVAVNGMLVYYGCLGTLGIQLSCCGAEVPGDWHEIPWLNMDFLNEGSDLVMRESRVDGKLLSFVTPYSCCTPYVLAACYHDPLQQAEWRSVWSQESPLVSASLHTRGCVEAVRAPLTRALLALQMLNLLVILFQVLILLLTQLLRSSARDATLRGDCNGLGVSSLFCHRIVQKNDVTEESNQSMWNLGNPSPAYAVAVRSRGRRRRKTYPSHSYPYLS